MQIRWGIQAFNHLRPQTLEVLNIERDQAVFQNDNWTTTYLN